MTPPIPFLPSFWLSSAFFSLFSPVTRTPGWARRDQWLLGLLPGRLFPGRVAVAQRGGRLFASLADDFLFLNVEYRDLHGNAEADGKFSTNCWTALASPELLQEIFLR